MRYDSLCMDVASGGTLLPLAACVIIAIFDLIEHRDTEALSFYFKLERTKSTEKKTGSVSFVFSIFVFSVSPCLCVP